MMKPNLFIIGAARCGTTSLYHYLDQHEEIYMSPVKEPGYFCKTDVSNGGSSENDKPKYVYEWQKYLELFDKAHSGHKAVGEASADYLYCEGAARKIKDKITNPKFIAILRNPVDRAYSHYKLFRNKNATQFSSFEEAIQKNPEYIERGMYYEQISRYYEEFPRSSLKVILFGEFTKKTDKKMEEIFNFLEVKTDVKIDTDKNITSMGSLK